MLSVSYGNFIAKIYQERFEGAYSYGVEASDEELLFCRTIGGGLDAMRGGAKRNLELRRW